MSRVASFGPQSTLDPAGAGAERVLDLFWVMAAGGVVIWLAVVGLSVYAIYVRPREHSRRYGRLLILGGGVIFPTFVLAVLLGYGLSMLPKLLAPAPPGSLRVRVIAEQWWWRVHYATKAGEVVRLANEIRLPVGEPVEFQLESTDVIHSFWIPSLGGKMDMIPGRTTRLTLEPTKTGVFRGVCAEYCGTSHALMAFAVVVLDPAEFATWLRRQAEPAREPAAPLAALGRESFVANGCGACHTVRGTEADGVVGPDLTHVGSRRTLGAGILPNEPPSFRAWISRTDVIKPSVHMPEFGVLPESQLAALAAYLESLE